MKKALAYLLDAQLPKIIQQLVGIMVGYLPYEAVEVDHAEYIS